ncbi:MAG: amidohydrolase family protein [Acidobacteria bacterium]|nr:amidohydrolase family protein [Acidobacteriota bacterium]
MRRFLDLTALALAALPAAWGETKLLENFTLIDGTGKATVPNAALLVVDGRIQYAGPKSGAPKAPAGAERVDLAGKFVMPGIMNMHSHLGNVVGLTADPKNFTVNNLNKQLKTYAQYGVTTVISMGSDQELIFDVRAAQRAGRDPRTRIFTAYRGFTGVKGYPTAAPGMKGVPYEVGTPAEIDAAMKTLVAKKVDLVKIWVDDHLGKEQKISIDLCQAIIVGARKHGLKVAAHIFYLDDAKKLVDAGLYGLAHSVRDKPVDGELIQLMKKRGAWQMAATFTREASMFVYANPDAMLSDPFFTRSLDATTLETIRGDAFQKKQANDKETHLWPGFLRTAQANLKKLADAGVPFAFGTDTGPPARFSGFFEHWEMELMAQAGLTPMQIIQSFSKNAAEFLGKQNDLGTLTKGHWADLVVLTKNPLDDIRNARAIDTVWIAGLKAN